MAKGEKCSLKEERFCQLYAGEARGNAYAAYKGSGFSTNGSERTMRSQATKIMQRPKVLARLLAIAAETPLVKSREDLQRWWSKTIDDDDEALRDRLKASELLGKSMAAFIEKHEHKVDASSIVTIYLPDNGRLPGDNDDW